MELEETTTPFEPVIDRRPFMPEPPPVRLEAVADCRLPAVAGQERALDDFYAKLLRFDRENQPDALVYRAENFRLFFDVSECPPERVDFIPLKITVRSLPSLIVQLRELQIEFEHIRSLILGAESILLKDPAGNLIQITETQRIL